MPNFREFSTRLAAMSGMRRVTATMKMVAASHLHRIQTELKKPEPFALQLRTLLPVAMQPRFQNHRLGQPPPEKDSRILLIVMSADRGLCGAFNSTVVREARQWIADQEEKRRSKISVLYVGQKASLALRAKYPAAFRIYDVPSHPLVKDSSEVAGIAMRSFLDGTYDEVWVINNRFVSTLVQQSTVTRLLPRAKPPDPPKASPAPVALGEPPRLIEPNDARMLETLAALWIQLTLHYALLNSVASEHAARVMAMENATVNLHRTEKELILMRNRARQAAITNELTEIVSGAESLN